MTPNRRVAWQATSNDENSWPRSPSLPRGRSRLARSGRESYRPSGSLARTRPRPGGRGPLLLGSGCTNSAGSRVATSRSSIAGRTHAASASQRSRPNSSGSRSTSLSRVETRLSRQSRCHRKSGATGRQHHRPVDPGDGSCRQATRTLARGCARSPPAGDHGQC